MVRLLGVYISCALCPCSGFQGLRSQRTSAGLSCSSCRPWRSSLWRWNSTATADISWGGARRRRRATSRRTLHSMCVRCTCVSYSNKQVAALGPHDRIFHFFSSFRRPRAVRAVAGSYEKQKASVFTPTPPHPGFLVFSVFSGLP